MAHTKLGHFEVKEQKLFFLQLGQLNNIPGIFGFKVLSTGGPIGRPTDEAPIVWDPVEDFLPANSQEPKCLIFSYLIIKLLGTIEQNVPQPFLMGLFWPLRQERGLGEVEKQHKVRLS